MEKELILVTGAAGFIGASVARKLISLGYGIITVDNLSTGYKENIPDGVYFIEGNVYDKEVIKQLNQFKFHAIMHIAGQSSGEISFDDPVYDLQTNTQSTLLLMQFARENGCKKFIYASTMSVYGMQPEGPVSENAVAIPQSFYAVGKLASEQYMRINSLSNLSCIALRLFNVYGPGQNMENMRQGMISIYMGQAFKNGHIQVKGDKNRFRDMIYIDDVCNAFLAALKYESSGFDNFNVCTNVKTTVDEAVTSIQKLFSKPITIQYEGSTAGDIFGIFGDNKKLTEKMGWRPETNFQDGLKKMFEWINSQKNDN
jgi:UDP-glucose 4-epimerase